MPTPNELDGQSLLPWMSGEAAQAENRILFFQCHRGLTPEKFQNCAVVTQQYKLIGNLGAFSRAQFDTSDEDSRLDLYDIPLDNGERNDLAKEKPEVVARLKAAYEKWYDDVRTSRKFRPGTIVIDSLVENPTVLSR